jgi:hypothetical protein
VSFKCKLRAKLPVGMFCIDPITAFCPNLDDPMCRSLMHHAAMIADALDCCVVLINHTHRNNPTRGQGSYVLEGSPHDLYEIVRYSKQPGQERGGNIA